jgi:vancomycin resistance protein YoaR
MLTRIGSVGLLAIGLFVVFALRAEKASAAYPILTYRHKHHLFTVDPNKYPGWRTPKEVWTYRGAELLPPPELLIDGDTVPLLPEGIVKSNVPDWNATAIRNSLTPIIGDFLYRERGSVVISRTGTGNATFQGAGLTGREVDLETAARLTVEALKRGITDIEIPVQETQPDIQVTDPELIAMGIKEVVTIGESDFSDSPSARRHNIAVGLAKFNGHLIPQGSTFSFVETLGPVNGATGYKRELVIKGDRTIPDYGGGLCQVSSTAYRGIWEYGFPIVQRKNHSFTVNHYFPQGTDATVYPPNVDIKFKNDGPSALLMQTHAVGDLAFFIYYGTKDERKSNVLGPFIWNRKAAPPDKFEYTTDLAPGAKKKIGERIPGMSALWYRFTKTSNGMVKTEPVYSHYEARPLFYQIGAEKGAAVPSEPVSDAGMAQPLPVTPEISLPTPPPPSGRARPRTN